MRSPDAAVFEDAESLGEWLADSGLVSFVEFEILTVTLDDAAIEIDPIGEPERLLPVRREFAEAEGFAVFPFDEDVGTLTIGKIPVFA